MNMDIIIQEEKGDSPMLWLMLVTVCSFFIKGLCGFANSMVFTTLL